MPARRKLSRSGEIWEEAAERATLAPMAGGRRTRLLVLAAFLAAVACGAALAWLAKALRVASG